MDIKSVIVLAIVCTAANEIFPDQNQTKLVRIGIYYGGRHGQRGGDGRDRSGYGQNRSQELGYQKESNCTKACVSSTQCPSREEIKSAMQAERQECKDCVMEECGAYDRSNRTDVSDCIMEAREQCSECPPMFNGNRERRANCTSCLKKCTPYDRRPYEGRDHEDNEDDDDDEEYDEDDEEYDEDDEEYEEDDDDSNVQETLRQCRQSCVSAGNCTSLSELKMRMRAARNACKECVIDDCGPYDRSNRSEIADCISDARMECDDCPAMSSQEQGERKQCRSCLSKCFMKQRQSKGNMTSGRPDRGRGRGRGNSYSGSGRQERQFFGGRQRPTNHLQALLDMIYCARNRAVCDSCPTAKELRQKMRNQSKECRDCVKEECGDIDKSNRTEVKECVSEARMECDDCSAVSEEDQMKRKNCSKCMRRCAVFRAIMSYQNGRRPYGNFPFGGRGRNEPEDENRYNRFSFGGYGSSRPGMPESNNQDERSGEERSDPGYFW